MFARHKSFVYYSFAILTTPFFLKSLHVQCLGNFRLKSLLQKSEKRLIGYFKMFTVHACRCEKHYLKVSLTLIHCNAFKIKDEDYVRIHF